MGTEIERKFLVSGEGWREHVAQASRIRQGYLAVNAKASIRIRIREGYGAQLTVKSGGHGLSRSEYEYDIPVSDAQEMLTVCSGRLVEKVRHLVPAGSLTWEIDVFSGDHAGLVIAEIELPGEGHPVDLPDWIGKEVTGDPAYNNSSLAGASIESE